MGEPGNHLDLQPVLKTPLDLSAELLESPLYMCVVLQSTKVCVGSLFQLSEGFLISWIAPLHFSLVYHLPQLRLQSGTSKLLWQNSPLLAGKALGVCSPCHPSNHHYELS